MAHRKAITRDGLWWGTTAAIFAGIFACAIAFVFAELYGAGWRSGAALGVLVFVIGGYVLARSATNEGLPPPNALKAPVAPPGGAFQAPRGGAFRAPDAPKPSARASVATPAPEPHPPASFADMSQSAGEAVGKVAYSASAAVTSAAQAAREAIAGVVGGSEPAPSTPVEAGDAVKPATLDAPREGGADDLKRIKGVGPKLEELLHSLGIYHFEQIASWGPAEIAWIDDNLEGFNGRATRDDWVGQSKLLAAGDETEFSQRVDKGEVY